MNRMLLTGVLVSAVLVCSSCSKQEKSLEVSKKEPVAVQQIEEEKVLDQNEVVASDLEQKRDESALWAVNEITTQEEFDALFAQGDPVVVKFYGSFCPPCHRMKPVFEKLAKEFTGQVVFAAIEVQQPGVRSLAQTYASRGVPSFVVFDASGEYLATRLGATAEATLSRFIADHCLGEPLK